MKDTIPEPPSFDISPSQLVQIAKTVSQDMQAATKRLVDAITPQDATFDNAILSLADIDNNLKGKVPVSSILSIRRTLVGNTSSILRRGEPG